MGNTAARSLLTFVSAALIASASTSAQSDEWTVFTSVVDQNGVPVDSLTSTDFVVRENGVTREILRAEQATDSVRVAVLVDTSQEIRNDIIDLRQGLRQFVSELDRRHHVALIGFGGPPTVLVNYTQDLKRLETGINRLVARPGTGSYLLSAIIDTSRQLRKQRDLRRVMVIVTAQGPEFSVNHQYRVVYARPKALIPPKTLEVGVKRPDVDVRAPRIF